jgi:hypothetical protein
MPRTSLVGGRDFFERVLGGGHRAFDARPRLPRPPQRGAVKLHHDAGDPQGFLETAEAGRDAHPQV